MVAHDLTVDDNDKDASTKDDGSHSITARISLENGTESEPSEALTLTVDTRAPELTSNRSAEAEILVAKGTLDRNNDGLVDGTNQSQILHQGAGLAISNANGGNKGNSEIFKTLSKFPQSWLAGTQGGVPRGVPKYLA